MIRIGALLLGLAALALADTVVVRDGSIHEGSVTKTEKTLSVGGESFDLDEVLLWENTDGVVQYAPRFAGHLRALEALAEREVLRRAVAALPKAIEAGAAADAQRLLETAERAGLAAKDADGWSRKIEKMKAKNGAAAKVPGDEVLTNLLAGRAQITLDAEKELRGWELLRAALRRDGKHEEAKDILDEVAPAHWKIGHKKEDEKDEMWQQRIWLDWHIDVLAGGVRAIGRLHPDMQRARAPRNWRKDLNGIETREEGAEIVFVTPMNDSFIVGVCVRYAKLTCRALNEMFKLEKPRREDNIPLVIYFYENKDAYVTYGGRGMPFIAMTAGFYTPGENISRFFWPTRRPDPLRAIRNTFVHELTHHWIERRNPRWHARDLAGLDKRVQVPGYWIGEGFATFIQEGRYDIRTWKWSHFNSKANSLDIVADLSKQKKLIKWEKVYTLTQAGFHGGDVDKKKVFATANKKWSIRPQPLVEIRLFYEQSASTCHFLYWGEQGKYRERLLDYVTNFYTSRKEKTVIKAAFGLEPEELGKKVEAFAKAIRNGWRPKE